MWGQRGRQWPNIEPILDKRLVSPTLGRLDLDRNQPSDLIGVMSDNYIYYSIVGFYKLIKKKLMRSAAETTPVTLIIRP